jgi:hypothetical protein
MTDFCKAVARCVAEWGRETAECAGDVKQIEAASHRLRQCLDGAFPDSQKVSLGGDKVNYMLSSVFFLANRLAKASQGLAEFDKTVSGVSSLSDKNLDEGAVKGPDFDRKLDEILSTYF